MTEEKRHGRAFDWEGTEWEPSRRVEIAGWLARSKEGEGGRKDGEEGEKDGLRHLKGEREGQ